MNLSVIMPCRNHAAYLDQSIQSILDQTYKKFNLYIFNDNSADNSLQIIEKYVKLDKRIKYFKSSVTQGATKALNFLLNNCNSEFIARQDSDDFSSHDRFEMQIPLLESNNIVSSDHFIIDESGIINEKISKANSDEVIKFNNMFYFYFGCHGNLMFKKNYYEENIKFCQDYELVSREINNGSKVSILNHPVYFYRKHKNTIFNNHRSKQILSSCKISQNNIKKTIDIDIPLENVLELRYFFTYDKKFNNSKNFIFLLEKIKNEFVSKQTTPCSFIHQEILCRLNYFNNIK